jgi:WD40 repeat protein
MSYGRALDGKLAPRLQVALQRFTKPWYRLRALRIFRDDASLSANPGLWSSIQAGLDASGHLILLASPGSAASAWVGREVEHWIANRGDAEIIIVATAGEIIWPEGADDFDWTVTDCLPPVLAGVFSEEPRWVDLRWARGIESLSAREPAFQSAVADIAVPLHDRPKEDLVGEDVRQHRLTRRVASGAIILLVALTVIAVVAAVRAVLAERTANSRSLAERANALLPTDPAESVSLARRAVSESRTAEAVTALDEALIESHECIRLSMRGGPASSVEFMPSGGEVIAAGPGSAAHVWSLDGDAARRDLRGDGSEVVVAHVNADGSRVAGRGRTGGLTLWDPGDGRTVAQVFGSRRPVQDLAFSPAGARLGVVLADGGVAVLDSGDGSVVARGKPPGSETLAVAVAYSPRGDALAVVEESGATVLWMIERRPGAPPRLVPTVLPGRRLGRAGTVTFTRSGRHVASGGEDGRVLIWKVGSPSSPIEVAGQPGAVFTLDAGRRETLAIGGQGGRARVVSAVTGRELLSLEGHTGLIAKIRFSSDGTQIATASDDGTVRIFDARSGGTRSVLAGHHANVRDVAFSADGGVVASAGFDGTVRVWDVGGGTSSRDVRGDGTSLLDAALDRSGDLAALSSAGRSVVLLPLSPRGGPAIHIEDLGGAVQRVAFLPKGDDLVVADHSGGVSLYDVRTLSLLWTAVDPSRDGAIAPLHSGIVYDISPSADGRLIATAGDDGRAWILDAATGAPILPRPIRHPDGGPILSARIDARGKRLLTAGADGTARIWDLATGEPLGRALHHARNLFEAVWSSDGRLVATASADGTAALWDAGTGERLHLLRVHSAPVSSVAFNEDGSLLLTTSQDGTAAIWEAASGRLRARLTGHDAPVLEARFGPDATVATASEDGTARLYDAGDGHRLGLLRGARSALTGLALTPDGQQLVTTSTDGFGRVYDLERAAPKAGRVAAGATCEVTA